MCFLSPVLAAGFLTTGDTREAQSSAGLESALDSVSESLSFVSSMTEALQRTTGAVWIKTAEELSVIFWELAVLREGKVDLRQTLPSQVPDFHFALGPHR